MDISQSDVRIKETDDTSDRTPRTSTSLKSDSFNKRKSTVEKAREEFRQRSIEAHAGTQKRKNFSRSQSVTAPKSVASKTQSNFGYSRQSSFSTMSVVDLENLKMEDLAQMISSRKEPIVTLAGSFTDKPNVTIGFEIKKEQKKEEE